MRKVGTVKSTVCSILVLLLCVTSITACGKKKNNGVSLEEAKKIDKNVIFKQEDMEGILEPGEEAAVIKCVGDKIKVFTRSDMGKSRLITFNPDGSDVQSVDVGSGKNFYVINGSFDKDGNAYLDVYEGKRNIEGMPDDTEDSESGAADEASLDASSADSSNTDASSAGTSAEETSADESEASGDGEDRASEDGKNYFVKLDPSGKEIAKVDLAQFAPKDNQDEGVEFNINNLTWTEKYGLICLTEEGVQTFDEKNGPQMLIEKKKICGEDGWIDNLIKLSENEMIISYYGGDDGEVNAILDLDKKEVGKPLEGIDKYGNYTFFSDNAGNLFASNDSGVYKYDLKGSKLNKILDFKDSNIGTGGYMWLEMVAISDTEFIASIPEDEQYSKVSLARLTKVNPEDVADKTIITLMSEWNDSEIGTAIMKFNRSNDKYQIKIINYNELYSDDWETIEKQFNLDITSGKAADIISVSGSEAAIRKYVDKGILMDLTPAFEKGGPLGDIEFLPNVAEMMKVDGKTYTFMPSFYVNSYAAKSKFLNGKTTLTFKEWQDIIENSGANYDLAMGTYNSKENMGATLWSSYGDIFVDWKNKKCNFNSPDFIEYLNFVNKFPDEEHQNEGKENGEWVDDDKFVAEDKTIFYRTFFSDPGDYARYKQLAFREDFEMVGLPNNSGENLASLDGSMFAVNNKTEHKDVILDLIKGILTDEKDSWYGFPTIKPKFEAQFQEATKEKPKDDQTYWVDPVTGKHVTIKPLSEEEAKKLHDYILSINKLDCYDEEINNIVQEETGAFFGGQKTAEQVAEVIQNRVTTYLNENS